MKNNVARFEQIGSLTRPESVLSSREEYKAGKISLEQLRQTEDAAILDALEMQRKVGVDVYTDGEYRRDAWQTNFSEVVSGFEDEYPVREVKNPDGSVSKIEMHTKAVVGKLKQNRRIVDVDAAFMKQNAPGQFKITMPAASMIYRGAFRAGTTEAAYATPKSLLSDVANIVRDEMKALIAEGVTYIQLDEGFTNLATEAAIARMREQGIDPVKQIEEQIEAENFCYDAVRGEGITLAAHLCRGSRTAAVKSLSDPDRTTKDFEFLAEHLFQQLHADRFLFEWDSGFEALRFLPKGKVAVLGLVTSLYPTLEKQDDLLRCFEEAAKYTSIDQLAISTQCGFQGSGTRDGAHMTIEEQQRKLELIANTAQKIGARQAPISHRGEGRALMAEHNYWTAVLQNRIGRRRSLTTAGGLVFSTAFLAACGGSEKSGSEEQASGLVSKAQDTSKEAKRGGTFSYFRNAEVFTFDQHLGLAGAIGALPFSRLFRSKPGYLEPEGWVFEGDMFESFEFSPDKLHLTGKVRPNFKWHNVAPVNGRQIDADDIVASWSRYEKIGQNRASFASKINPDAPIESMSAVDNRTVRIKMSQPISGVLGVLATSSAGMYFLPKEADAGYDPRNICIGSGTWMVGDNQPSIRLTLKRHEGHYNVDKLFPNERTEAVIPEYAAGLAQFRTGALHHFAVRQEYVVGLKKELPALDLYAIDPPANHAIFKWGWNPALGSATPFRDKRLRQAFAMSVDRDLLMDTIYNVTKFASEGIPLKSYLYTSVQTSPSGVFGGEASYWLNPRGKDFGPNAKYFAYNVAEAKKLVAAAGFASGLDSVAHYSSGYGDADRRMAEVYIGFAREVGLRLKNDDSALNTEFRPKFGDPQGDYDGVAFRRRPAGGIFDSVEIAVSEYIPSSGIAYTGFFSDTGTYKQGDPRYTTLLKKARQEFDENKRRDLMYDFQRMEAEDQYQPSFMGTAENLALYWPAVRNVNVYRDDRALSGLGLWMDPTKKPLSNS